MSRIGYSEKLGTFDANVAEQLLFRLEVNGPMYFTEIVEKFGKGPDRICSDKPLKRVLRWLADSGELKMHKDKHSSRVLYQTKNLQVVQQNYSRMILELLKGVDHRISQLSKVSKESHKHDIESQVLFLLQAVNALRIRTNIVISFKHFRALGSLLEVLAEKERQILLVIAPKNMFSMAEYGSLNEVDDVALMRFHDSCRDFDALLP